MCEELKQPVIVENRPGAGGRLAAEAVKIAPADGSVLMLTPIIVTVLAPMVFSKLPYDPIADFAPVVQGTAWFAVHAPAKTPEATVRQLNAAVNKAIAAPEVRERFQKLGLEPSGGTPADLAARMAQDTARWAPSVRASGFRAD